MPVAPLERLFIVTAPAEFMLMRCCPAVLRDKISDIAEKPVPVMPLKFIFGVPAALAGTVSVDVPATTKFASVASVPVELRYKFVVSPSSDGAHTNFATVFVGSGVFVATGNSTWFL